MPNLFDQIKLNRASLSGTQAGVTDETGKLQTLLRAKSGRTVGPGDTATSNLGEQAAVAQANQQLQQAGGQLQQQQAAETAAIQGQAQDYRSQKQDIDQAQKFNTLQTQMKTNQLLADLGRDKDSLSLDKDRGRLEQASFLLAMQDKQYTDQLQDIGRRRRLDDAVAFQQELAQMEFGANLDLLKTKLKNGDVLSSSDRDFKQALSSLSIADAMKVAEIEMAAEAKASELERDAAKSGATLAAKAANTQSMYQGVGKVVETGIQGYDKYKDNQSTNKPQTGTTK